MNPDSPLFLVSIEIECGQSSIATLLTTLANVDRFLEGLGRMFEMRCVRLAMGMHIFEVVIL